MQNSFSPQRSRAAQRSAKRNGSENGHNGMSSILRTEENVREQMRCLWHQNADGPNARTLAMKVSNHVGQSTRKYIFGSVTTSY